MVTFGQLAGAIQDLLRPAEGPIKAYKEIKELRGLFTNKGSIIRLIKNFLVEPTIFVSKSVREEVPNQEFYAINDQLDLFCSFYTQAFKILTGLYDVDARVAVDLLGTSGFDYNLGDSLEDLATGKKFPGLNDIGVSDDIISKFRNQNFLTFELGNGVEDPRSSNYGAINPGLLSPSNFKQYQEKGNDLLKNNKGQTLVAHYASARAQVDDLNNQLADTKNFNKQRYADVQAKNQASIHTANRNNDGSYGINGKLHEQGNYGYQMREFVISIVNKNKVVIEVPITVKANLVFVKPEELINALMPKRDDKSIFARWDKWRSGGIKFWSDLVFCSDLIRDYKENKLKDKEDIIGKINSSEIGSITRGLITGQVGYERFYNMYLVTANDKQKVEQYLRGKLDSPKFKENFLMKSNGLSLMVLDPDWELAHVYIKDINKPSIIKFDKMGKRKNKDGSLNEVFKSLFAQQPPVF